jgi:hypothetical protein
MKNNTFGTLGCLFSQFLGVIGLFLGEVEVDTVLIIGALVFVCLAMPNN